MLKEFSANFSLGFFAYFAFIHNKIACERNVFVSVKEEKRLLIT